MGHLACGSFFIIDMFFRWNLMRKSIDFFEKQKKWVIFLVFSDFYEQDSPYVINGGKLES